MAAPTYEASLVAVSYASSGPPTFTEVCGLIPIAGGVRFIDQLGLPGQLDLEVQVDSIEPVGTARLRDLSVAPCEVWLRRGGTSIVFAGPVTGCHLHDRTITITAPGLLKYLEYWMADVNVLTALNGSAATEYMFSGIDQAVIVQRLADAWQGLAYGHDGIVTTGLSATGITRDLTLSARDGKYIMPLMTEMGGRNNGFDLSVDPNTRKLTMWSPRKGTDRTTGPAAVILDRRSIGVPDLSWTVAPGQIGSEVFASSNSTQGVTLTSIRSNTVLRSTFGRSYISRSYQDISVQATLDDHAQRTVDDNSTQVFTAAPELLPVPGFAYGDFATGDLILYSFDGGLGEQTFTARVGSIEVSTGTGRELLKVGLI